MKKKIKDLAEGLKGEHRWNKNIGEELVLKFKYLTPLHHDRAIYDKDKFYTNLTPFTEEQREITQSVLDEIAVKTGLEFKMVEGTEFSNLTFGNYNAIKNRLVGYAFPPNNYSGVSPIWVNFASVDCFKEIITHEIGHAIGLQHVTQAGYSSADSIMWPITSSTKELQPADILALKQLYGQDTNPDPEEREKILKRQQEREKKREVRKKEQKKQRAAQEQAEQLLAKERKRRQQEVQERANKLAREREIALRQEQEWIRLEQKRVNKRRAAREAAEEKRQRQIEERAKEEARIVKEHEEQWQRMKEERRQMEEERKKQWERIKEERAQRKREYDQEYTKRREQRERERNEKKLPAENYLAQDMSSFTFHSSLQGSFQGRLINRNDEQSHKGFFSGGVSLLGDAANLSLR
ncbi:Membrane protein involved in colicin uptake [Candidatus Regiella insecticola 5.15]|uniref:Membrane protein involved in colicin uptake n=1 Tax=Candidatus Regiella insecticola 5.15 TaxID=1005043 RepID=G2GWG3_9ENTR|nr:matrixin family metalloprotease [Candidatus Regiella insecticola]EGY29922.1 Membrane protein involved in colicin uptake [Candidatus Regiella insecticola 5.15]